MASAVKSQAEIAFEDFCTQHRTMGKWVQWKLRLNVVIRCCLDGKTIDHSEKLIPTERQKKAFITAYECIEQYQGKSAFVGIAFIRGKTVCKFQREITNESAP